MSNFKLSTAADDFNVLYKQSWQTYLNSKTEQDRERKKRTHKRLRLLRWMKVSSRIQLMRLAFNNLQSTITSFTDRITLHVFFTPLKYTKQNYYDKIKTYMYSTDFYQVKSSIRVPLRITQGRISCTVVALAYTTSPAFDRTVQEVDPNPLMTQCNSGWG